MSCLACGEASEWSDEIKAPEMMLGLREPFHYGECRTCASLTLIDPPADLGRYYPAESYYSLDEDVVRSASRLSRRAPFLVLAALVRCGQAERIQRLMERFPALQRDNVVEMLAALRLTGVGLRGARVLDVGSGAGFTTILLAQLGAVADGIDPHAREWRSGRASTRVGDIDDAVGPYDIVLFQHSLEHMPDPARALRLAREHLASAGRILVRIPVADGFASRRYGGQWVQLDAPRHLFVPSVDGIRRLAARAGLDVSDLVWDSNAFQFWGSEQYRLGIPLTDPRSAVNADQSLFTAEQMAQWRAEARSLNERGQGDTISVVLTAAS